MIPSRGKSAPDVSLSLDRFSTDMIATGFDPDVIILRLDVKVIVYFNLHNDLIRN